MKKGKEAESQSMIQGGCQKEQREITRPFAGFNVDKNLLVLQIPFGQYAKLIINNDLRRSNQILSKAACQKGYGLGRPFP